IKSGMGGTGNAAGSTGGSAGENGGAAGAGGAPSVGSGGMAGSASVGGETGAGGVTNGVAGTRGSGGAAGGLAGSKGDLGSGGSASGGSGGGGGGVGGGNAGSLGVGGGSGGSGGSAAGSGGGSGAAGKSGSGGNGCSLPATVSFQKDVQPFLSTTCGGGNGCHVIDSASTVANGGYDHAYDWITAGAHPSSCPNTPTPKRFEVVIAVIDAADPPSCSKSRMMPPQDETGANLRKPLTVCQIATLQGWLDEPLVTQMHRVDDTDPTGTAPFPMPPFN
ncbi:MAG TPA: hypothetical protein VFG23_08945, partial [Polyangia bacterium]|nr:hypothetical protein [Polyangia bacterium]